MEAIVKLYVKKIRAGKMTLSEVPDKWKQQVRHALNS